MIELASKLAALSGLADDVSRQARATRYRFNTRPLSELRVLRQWLEEVGATSRDTIYKALLEHIAARELSEARGRSAAKRKRRESHG